MKGGVVLALGVARALASRPEAFAEIGVLLVTDEEWRTHPFAHVERFAGYDACLCFEAGERTPDGEEGVVVRRKAAGTLRVSATGRASHSGSAPDQGRNALLALAETAVTVARGARPGRAGAPERRPDRRSAPGDALNVVPAAGELVFDMRADRQSAFDRVLAAVPAEAFGATIEPTIEREWPGMDTGSATAPLLERAGAQAGAAARRRAARRRQRRKPLRPGDPADRRRARPARWRRSHARGIRARAVAERARRDRARAGARDARAARLTHLRIQ